MTRPKNYIIRRRAKSGSQYMKVTQSGFIPEVKKK